MENYEQLDAHIGQGTYGKVEKARDKRDGQIVAIKKVKVESLLSAEDEQSMLSQGKTTPVANVGIHFTVLREIKVMRELNHPNVISIRDVYVDGDFVNLVMPHMVSDLRKFLDRRVRLTEAQVKCILRQILLGLTELHANWILHRDLAPANIFIGSDGICKLADFGLARGFGSPRPSKKTPRVVTLWYRAPELLFGARFYQDRVDVWSTGCIFGEMLLGGRPLFPGTEEIDQLARIFELMGTPDPQTWPEGSQLPQYIDFTHCEPQEFRAVFPGVSETALDLLRQMLCLNPAKRISAAQALEHPYFSALPLACEPSELPLHALQ